MKRCCTYLGLALLYGLMATGCATVDPVGSATNMLSTAPPEPTRINWPEQYTPERATFYVKNEIDIDASPEMVWQVIIEAESWPEWYEGAFGVTVADSDDGVLRSDSSFTWKTMGFWFTSVIHEYDPPTRLAWESRRSDLKAYHAWLIIPTGDGCRVITEESQFGLLANLQNLFQPNKLRRLHDVWLADIKERAEARTRDAS